MIENFWGRLGPISQLDVYRMSLTGSNLGFFCIKSKALFVIFADHFFQQLPI